MRLTALGPFVLLLSLPLACDQHKTQKTEKAEEPTEKEIVTKGAGGGGKNSGAGKEADKHSLDDANLVADLGFRPVPNGFGFRNFVLNDPDDLKLGPKDLKKLCGEKAVCAGGSDDEECTLKAGAQAFLDASGRMLKGGHCEGFSVGSLRLWANEDDLEKFGTDKTVDLDKKTKVERYLAYWAVTQMSPTVAHATYRAAPNKVLSRLITTMKKKTESYVLGIYRADGKGGHAIVPYAVEDRGDDIFWVYVYENNSPTKLRHVEFDKSKNSWRYDDAATSPEDTPSVYGGTSSAPHIELIPQSSRNDMACPFAKNSSNGDTDDDDDDAKPKKKKKKKVVDDDEETESSSGEDDTMLIGRNTASLSVTDDAGHTLGVKNGEMVSEIPGATYVIPRGKLAGVMGPILYVPAKTKVQLTMRGTDGESDDVAIIGKKFAATLTNVSLSNKPTQTIEIDGSKKQISFVGGAPKADKIELYVDQGKTVQKIEVPKMATIDVGSKLQLDTIKGKMVVADKVGGFKPIAAPMIPVFKPIATPKAELAPIKPIAPVAPAPMAPIKPNTMTEPVKPGQLAPVKPVAPGTVAPVAPVAPLAPVTPPVKPIAPGTVAPVAPAPVAPGTVAPIKKIGKMAPVK